MEPARAMVVVLGVTMLSTGRLAAPSEGSAKKFFWKQCDEDVLQVRVDAGPLQEVVGPEFSVVAEEGKALVLIVVQDCPAHWIDGEEIGPTEDVHQWVAIGGPGDVRPVAGAERTLPTFTWFALFAGSSNARIRESWTAAGTPALPLRGVSLHPHAPRQRGRVSVAEGLGFSWQAQSAEPFARLVAVNHDLYARDRAGRIVYHRIQALINVFSWDSPGTMEVVGGTEPRKLIGSGSHPVLMHSFRPLWAWGTLDDVPPER